MSPCAKKSTAAATSAIVPVDTTGCTFDQAAHVYAIDGQEVVSVTQVLNAIGFVDFSRIPSGTLSEAQARGSYVHTCLHYFLEGDFDLNNVAEPYRGYVDSAVEYLNVAGLKPLRDAGGNAIAVEYRFWDRVHRFAGTIDYVAYDPDGVLAIIDWKTGMPSDVAAPLQLAAYEYGLRTTILQGHQMPIRRRAIKLYREGKPGRVEPYDNPNDLGMFFNALSCVHYKRNGMQHAA